MILKYQLTIKYTLKINYQQDFPYFFKVNYLVAHFMTEQLRQSLHQFTHSCLCFPISLRG